MKNTTKQHTHVILSKEQDLQEIIASSRPEKEEFFQHAWPSSILKREQESCKVKGIVQLSFVKSST